MKKFAFFFIVIFLNVGAISCAFAVDEDSCSPDNGMRADIDFMKSYDVWRTRLAERVADSVEKGRPKVFFGKSYEFSEKLIAFYWIDGLDPFSVFISRQGKRVILNAASVISEREHKPAVKKASPKKNDKSSKSKKEDVAEEEESPGREELHIEIDLGAHGRKLTQCTYEIRGSYVFLKLVRDTSSDSSEL